MDPALEIFSMDGLILTRKPPLVTSHDVVKQIRSLLPGNKTGHFGTLDPLATGLLMLAIGSTTRLFPFFSKLDKAYEGTIRLGFSTDTYDSQGKPTSTPSTAWPQQSRLEAAMEDFLGSISQLPPPYSAKKYKGQPLYKLARANQPTPRNPSNVTVEAFLCLSYAAPDIEFRVRCSSGTYIRSLAHDLGQSLGCGAHLARLVRTEVGRFRLEDAHSLEDISRLKNAGDVHAFLLPIEELLPEFPRLILTEEGTSLANHGNLVAPQHIARIFESEIPGAAAGPQGEQVFRLFSEGGRLLAFARRPPGQGGLHPFLVVDTGEADK